MDEIQLEMVMPDGRLIVGVFCRGVGLIDLTGGPGQPLPDPDLVEWFRREWAAGNITTIRPHAGS